MSTRQGGSTLVALLRDINVGGRAKMMSDLRQLFDDLGVKCSILLRIAKKVAAP